MFEDKYHIKTRDPEEEKYIKTNLEVRSQTFRCWKVILSCTEFFGLTFKSQNRPSNIQKPEFAS